MKAAKLRPLQSAVKLDTAPRPRTDMQRPPVSGPAIERDERMNEVLADRVLHAAQSKAPVATGYADLVTAAQAKPLGAIALSPSEAPERNRTPQPEDPAERQADEIGNSMARDLTAPVALRSGPLPGDIRSVAQRHLGVGLHDVHLQAEHDGNEKARKEGALAVTQGRNISFGAGQLTTATHRGRALLGHELTHVAQQATAETFTTQCQTPDGSEPGSDQGMTLAPPPGHEERKGAIELMKQELVPQRATRDELRARLDSVPKVSSVETQAERQTLRTEIRGVEERMLEVLTTLIGRIDEALGALRAVLPTTCEPGTPDVPEPLWEDLRRLESDKKAAEAERKTLQRMRARDELRELEDRLAELDAKDPKRAELEEQKKNLGAFLSESAEHRVAPGTAGKSRDGHLYVVYVHSVKVGGSTPWRNNNPGNVQRSRAGGDFPGVLGVDQFQHFIFDSVDSGRNAVYLDLEKRRGGPNTTLASALRSYVAGSQKDEDLPADEAECKRRGIPPATCVTKEIARTYPSKVTRSANLPLEKTLGELNDAERSALVDAILRWEGGTFGNKGNEFTYGVGTIPEEYRELLGCEE